VFSWIFALIRDAISGLVTVGIVAFFLSTSIDTPHPVRAERFQALVRASAVILNRCGLTCLLPCDSPDKPAERPFVIDRLEELHPGKKREEPYGRSSAYLLTGQERYLLAARAGVEY